MKVAFGLFWAFMLVTFPLMLFSLAAGLVAGLASILCGSVVVWGKPD